MRLLGTRLFGVRLLDGQLLLGGPLGPDRFGGGLGPLYQDGEPVLGVGDALLLAAGDGLGRPQRGPHPADQLPGRVGSPDRAEHLAADAQVASGGGGLDAHPGVAAQRGDASGQVVHEIGGQLGGPDDLGRDGGGLLRGRALEPRRELLALGELGQVVGRDDEARSHLDPVAQALTEAGRCSADRVGVAGTDVGELDDHDPSTPHRPDRTRPRARRGVAGRPGATPLAGAPAPGRRSAQAGPRCCRNDRDVEG